MSDFLLPRTTGHGRPATTPVRAHSQQGCVHGVRCAAWRPGPPSSDTYLPILPHLFLLSLSGERSMHTPHTPTCAGRRGLGRAYLLACAWCPTPHTCSARRPPLGGWGLEKVTGGSSGHVASPRTHQKSRPRSESGRNRG